MYNPYEHKSESKKKEEAPLYKIQGLKKPPNKYWETHPPPTKMPILHFMQPVVP
jgi:hypothetical protein